MAWKLPPSVKAGLHEATQRWPRRSRVSDGTIGDPDHAARKSDHNPDSQGWVHAFDLTHDPANGVDCEALAEHLRTSRDPRVKYVIWNRRVFSSYSSAGRAAWAWGRYTGPNPHTKHMHVSIASTDRARKDTSPWWATTSRHTPHPPQPPQESEDLMYILHLEGTEFLFLVGGPGQVFPLNEPEFWANAAAGLELRVLKPNGKKWTNWEVFRDYHQKIRGGRIQAHP